MCGDVTRNNPQGGKNRFPAGCCVKNNLKLNTRKTKEMVVERGAHA